MLNMLISMERRIRLEIFVIVVELLPFEHFSFCSHLGSFP